MIIILTQKQIDFIKKFDEGAKSLKCRNCNKFFTQTTHKKKKSLPICHHCGTHNTQYSQEVDEVTKYDFNDPTTKVAKHKKKKDYSLLKNDPENQMLIKKLGKFEFYFSTLSDESEIIFSVIDSVEKVMVAKAPFFMMNLDDLEASAPYVDPEYRNLGIGKEIYKIALDFGNVISGKHQSQYAVGLWKKLYRELPNKMVAIDRQTNREYPVTLINDKLVIDAEDGQEIYGEDSDVILKLERN